MRRAARRFADRVRRRLNGRRLRGLHARCVDPARLTLHDLMAASAMLGLDADDVLAGRVDRTAIAETVDARRFLDLTHPGHGLDFDVMPAGEIAFVAGVAAANFTMAPTLQRISQAATSADSGSGSSGAFSPSPAPTTAPDRSSPPSAP